MKTQAEALGIDSRRVAAMQRLSGLLSLAVAGLGVLVLVGWTLELTVLEGLPWATATMKPNTALLFVALGLALYLFRDEAPRRLRDACVWLIATIGALTLLEYVVNQSFGIDDLLRLQGWGPNPPRMALTTALCFVLFATALLGAGTKTRRASDLAVLIAGGISFVSVAGYLYGAPALHRSGSYGSVAMHTAFGFIASTLAFVTARPATGMTAALASSTSAGTVLRRTLPLVLLVPLLLGWVSLSGERAGWYDSAFGTAVVIAASSGLLGAALALVSGSLHRSELGLRRAEAAIAQSEQRLRQLVEGSPYSIAMFDRELRYVFASGRWLTDYGLDLTREQIRGRSHYELFPNIPEHWKELNRRCLVGETIKSDAEPFVRRDGVAAWVRRELKPWHDEHGLTNGIVVFSKDVSEQKRADLQLRRASEQFRLALEAAPAGMLLVDEGGSIRLVNMQIEQLFGYRREELLGRPIETLVPQRVRAKHAQLRHAYFTAPASRVMGSGRELRGLRKDGTEVPIEIAFNPLQTPDGLFVLSSVVDISERKEIERQRAELLMQRLAAERHTERSRFFELSLDLVCIANTSGYFVQLNPAFQEVLGYSVDEMLRVPFLDFVHPEDVPATRAELAKLAHHAATFDFTNRCRCKDGSYRWLQWRCIPDADGVLYAIARDVTGARALVDALQSKQLALTASLRERDVLLQEIHHRVKNNLQIIASLINMQARQLSNEQARGALAECRARVVAMGLIHEKLYQSKDYSRVPFSQYARGLAASIFAATGTFRAPVRLDLDLEEVSLQVDKAIPCGLILNELITNASKHAFPGDRTGTVRVALHTLGDQQISLSVADDGVGLPEAFEPSQSSSLGMQLVATLVAQLNGQLEITGTPGAQFKVTFSTASAA